MESNEGKETIGIHFNRKDAIPDAPRYEFTTVAEIMAALTSENVDRFLDDFATGIKGTVLMIEAMKSVVELTGVEVTPEMMGANKFVWIDDAPRTIPTP